jgi:hypothetical protein
MSNVAIPQEPVDREYFAQRPFGSTIHLSFSRHSPTTSWMRDERASL